jgi:alpha-L-fucosidase
MIRFFNILILLVLLFSTAAAQKEESDNRYAGNRNKPEREDWLRDFGFGMFIHFTFDSQLGIVPSHSMVGASDDFLKRFILELPETFDPKEWDPHKIVSLARLAGMKYIVFTTKHHSGFCFWDTKTTSFKITNTPYKKDFLKEFVEVIRKEGLGIGLYYSPEDFKFLYDHKEVIKRGDVNPDPVTMAAYVQLIRMQTRELFSNYGKIDVLFIDGEPKEPCKEEAWKLQPDLIITRGAINTPEQYIPGTTLDALWESNVTIGTEWTYKPTNDNLKSGGRLIEILIETRAKGGNFLLNIGPHPYGYLPIEQESRIREVAAWNFINHEAIEKTRPWIISHEDNIWFTASKDKKTIYAIVTGIRDWEFGTRKEFVLNSVKATPETKISVLGQNDKVIEYHNDWDAKSYYSQKEDGLHVSVARAQRIYTDYKWPNPITIKLEDILPSLEPPVVITMEATPENGGVRIKGTLKPTDNEVILAGFEYHLYGGFAENIYNTQWDKTEYLIPGKNGEFSLLLKNLEKGKEYEYRAVIKHPKIEVKGENLRFVFTPKNN